MQIEMLYSKIHRATVTDADLNYVGSITIDEELMEAAKLRVGQKVEILNINNGERFQTYVIKGERGKRDICLNGAAARKAHPGDKIIIVAYALFDESELENYEPTVVLVNDENDIEEIISYM
ncbi:aspartate 1-decarboxylase [Nitratiruptor sp. SB155-2]|uniref:aspartate 1-decarboxylase n=1 Tax=Nitratiruptor sp. (strain SB155-2) TaxID=387092 RepID=UPI0001586D6E|nr:aspartate 1-decarboxylase [Nitratiruptor sp. SB155-2]BAF69369.1 aspartate decarboxylase [Nitratiruptor sp. SB155-2]